jgi:hypothetical protein
MRAPAAPPEVDEEELLELLELELEELELDELDELDVEVPVHAPSRAVLSSMLIIVRLLFIIIVSLLVAQNIRPNCCAAGCCKYCQMVSVQQHKHAGSAYKKCLVVSDVSKET